MTGGKLPDLTDYSPQVSGRSANVERFKIRTICVVDWKAKHVFGGVTMTIISNTNCGSWSWYQLVPGNILWGCFVFAPVCWALGELRRSTIGYPFVATLACTNYTRVHTAVITKKQNEIASN